MHWDRPPSNPWLKLWSLFWSIFALGGLTLGGVAWARRELAAIDNSLPDPSELLTYARGGTITIKAADGSILQQIGDVTHEKLDLADTPTQLIQAFLAAEDHRFYEHDGVDYQAIARAAVTNWRARAWLEGGSTLTQQLARMVFLTQDLTLERKLREARLAQEIERTTSKEEILQKYLNLVYLGSGAYGVTDAAWVYFAKSPQELTLPEMALLAGLPAAPSDYSPEVSPKLAQQRRNTVLRRMAEVGYISETEADKAIAQPIALNLRLPKRLEVRLPYFTSYIQQELPNYVSDEEIENGGLTVETSLDPHLQELAQEVVRQGVARYGWQEGFTEGALVAIDPRNGEIRALVGGTGFEQSQFNRATQALRQPGSTFKGIIYATAIAAGLSPHDVYEDVPYSIAGYQPRNYGGGYAGKVTLQNALAQSINIVAVKLLADIGFEPTLEVAQKMGIESELGEVYPLALGAFEVTLLEMTRAYGTLANQGQHYPSRGIRRILAADGTVLFDAQDDIRPQQAIDPDSAAIMTSMLRQVVDSGTGRPAQLDRPVAGKTGTSDNSRDLWFIGYVPQLTVGVWLGNDNNAPTYGSSGTAARVWRLFMAEALQGMAIAEFPSLPDLAFRTITLKPQPEEPETSPTPEPRQSGDDWQLTWGDRPLAPPSRSASGNSQKQPDRETRDRALEYGTEEYFRRRYGLDPAPSEPVREWEATPSASESDPLLPPRKEIVIPEALEALEGEP
ncbi:MAG: penicillin-binding protein 1A [Phormidium sp. BM_Day4_Bin.17]|nr:penicillin-binding protein 1A [Phormidium sp. BM_Day4_Bin.17]UCJ13016.1 MAG: penicillin-binding protein 1A [Phormidium sp. PBR-2020]